MQTIVQDLVSGAPAAPSRRSPFAAADLVVRVLAEDPALGERLDPASFAAAERLAARGFVAAPGSGPIAEVEDRPGMLGLLVLDGLLIRRVRVAGSTSSEVLGRGDVLRPWQSQDAVGASIEAASSWKVVLPARLAILDRRFALEAARWPEIMAALLERETARARRLAFHCTVAGVPRLDPRMLLVLWHLADRWGRMTSGGAHLPLPLSHDVLAEIAGARRPSVSLALRRLRERRRVVRLPDRTWLLPGEPPEPEAPRGV